MTVSDVDKTRRAATQHIHIFYATEQMTVFKQDRENVVNNGAVKVL